MEKTAGEIILSLFEKEALLDEADLVAIDQLKLEGHDISSISWSSDDCRLLVAKYPDDVLAIAKELLDYHTFVDQDYFDYIEIYYNALRAELSSRAFESTVLDE